MFRVDTPTAVESLPAQQEAGTPGFFTKGDAAGGVPATIPGPDWYNIVQEEIMAVITGAGLTPAKATLNQMLQAIKLLSNYADDTGSANIYTATLLPAWTGHKIGVPVYLMVSHTNTTASTFSPNGVTPAPIRRPNLSVLQPGDMTAGTIVKMMYDGTYYQLSPSASASIYPGAMGITNLGLEATVGSKALTVALKGADGAAPSASNPVKITFRSATLTSGTPTEVSVTEALSIVLSSGSKLGFTAAEAGRLYIWALNNAGTVELALSRTADIFQESALITTTAEGGAGAADSAIVMYSTTQRTSLACRCIGYIEITTGGVAGEWDNAPTKIQVMGPGIKRTGETVQTISFFTGEMATGSTTTPGSGDDTVPLYTEGNLFISAPTVVMTSAINKYRADVILQVSGHTSQACLTGAIYDGQVCIGAANIWGSSTADLTYPMIINTGYLTVGAIGSVTKALTVRCGEHTYAATLNGYNGSRRIGGALKSGIIITEVMT